MSLPVQQHRYTIEEYLRIENDSSDRHEYFDGEVIAMAGGTPQHSLIISNIIGETRARLKGSHCRVYDANLRVRVPRKQLYVYPDATVICGPPEFDANDRSQLTVVNPRVIFEVLSASTENRDYGIKFRRYLECPTLDEYVIVAQDIPSVQTCFRQSDGTWLLTPISDLNSQIALRSIKISLPMAEVYAGVEFPSPET